MRYKTYLISFSVLLLSSQAVHGQELRYRVELLVLRHLDSYSASQPAPELKDFSAALDLLAPPAESSLPGQADLPGVQAVHQTGVQAEVQSGDRPLPPVVLQETPGEVMQQAWRRLRSANGLRPELYFSWEQAASAGAPEIRIHDKDLLFEQDPYANLQDASAFQPAGVAKASSGVAMPVSGDVHGPADGVPGGADPSAGPALYYRLDGTARLRVSRFLHLDLDIEYREPAEAAAQQAVATPATTVSTGPGPGTPVASAWQVYTIRQSRQLQIQDLHYFDGPVISVLALVSRVEPLPEAVQ